jgi:hypothetical protein
MLLLVRILGGRSRVIGIQPAEIDSGPGCVVAMTINHLNSALVDVVMEGGETLETTAYHPFWSEDRQDWVQASSLEPGELLRTLTGVVRVASIHAREGVERVFNIEVEQDHTYVVGDIGAWVHNTCNTRINVPYKSFRHIIDRHISPAAKGSKFSIKEGELRGLLASEDVVSAPVRQLDSGGFLREVDVGRVIGNDKYAGNAPTSVLSVITDAHGNLESAFPGVLR